MAKRKHRLPEFLRDLPPGFASNLHDTCGTPVPAWMKEDWAEGVEARKCVEVLNRRFGQICTSRWGRGAGRLALTRVRPQFKQMIETLLRTLPYAVCPQCLQRGRRQHTCQCQGAGWINYEQYAAIWTRHDAATQRLKALGKSIVGQVLGNPAALLDAKKKAKRAAKRAGSLVA